MRYLDGDGRVFLNRNKRALRPDPGRRLSGGYVPFHLLTREFYALVKQRLAPGGAAAFNVHDGTKLYASTCKTLGEVFPTLDLYPTGRWRSDRGRDRRAGAGQAMRSSARAAALQEQTASAFRCRRC